MRWRTDATSSLYRMLARREYLTPVLCCEPVAHIGAVVAFVVLLTAAVAKADNFVAPPRDKTVPVPLLVVLHGDGERAAAAGERWRIAARERGWAIFAPQ